MMASVYALAHAAAHRSRRRAAGPAKKPPDLLSTTLLGLLRGPGGN